MKAEIHRRSFLGKLLQLAGAAMGLQSCVSPSPITRRPFDLLAPPPSEDLSADAREIARKIEDAFPYLDLDPAGLAAFARDFVSYRNGGELKPGLSTDVEQRFLLSSSFFDDGADESRTVEYVTFFDPYITPCSNRLAQPAVDEEESEAVWPGTG